MICDIFPTAVAIHNLDVEQTEFNKLIELSTQKDLFIKNENDNFFHKETYIFDTILKGSKLVEDIKKYVDQYSLEILGEEPGLRHTQSWLNVNPPGTSHHKHFHGNSIISGVLYLQANEDTGHFQIHREEQRFRHISKEIVNYNQYNYRYLFFEPKPFDLYLFPSSLLHSVEENKSELNRISVSFNTFYQGDITTSANDLTEIRFK